MSSSAASYGADILRRVRVDAASWLAFAALLAWMFGLYWSDVQLGLFPLSQGDVLQMRALWLGSEAAALLVALLVAARLVARACVAAVVSGALLFAGTVTVLFGPAMASSEVLQPVGVALTGAGSAGLLVLLGVSLARKGAKALLIDVALALLVASALDAVLLLLPSTAQQLVLALLPAAGSAFTVLAVRDGAALSTQSQGTARPGFSTVRVVALPTIVGLAYGLMQRLAEGAFPSDGGVGNAATIVSFAISALVITLTALFLDSRKLIKAACFVAIPVIGIAFVMLPLFSGAREAILGVCIVGFNSFYFIVWALWADARDGSELPRRFTLGLLVLVAAECSGSLLGLFVLEAVEGSEATLAVVSLVVVYLLLMAGILSFDRSMRAALREGGIVKGPEPSIDLQTWATRYGLSAREQEVFEMLARGRNRAYISKALVVSDNTTRTHMKNVYRKLGVHSQQELIDLVESGRVGEGEPW